MRYRQFHYRWEWSLRASPEALWPLVADTNRFNRDTGVPPIQQAKGDAPPLPNGRRSLRLTRLGVPIAWEEEPFEWARPWHFGVTRRYRGGPVAQMSVLTELAPLDSGGTRLTYQVWARAGNPLGLAAIPFQIGLLSARAFDAAIRRYDALALARQDPILIPAAVTLAPGGRDRLAAFGRTLRDQGADPALLDRLVATIEQADDLTAMRLRPYALADAWGASRSEVLSLCLQATRAGLLDLRWEILCPSCRGAKSPASTLRDLRAVVHCESCQIDITADFARQVELAFTPSQAVREVAVAEYCVGGPQVTPHILAQLLLPPGARREIALPLAEGLHRLRNLALPGSATLRASAAGPAIACARVSAAGWPDEEIAVSLAPSLTLENATGQERLFILERLAWGDQAVTAAAVTARQDFRDLFASEALRPGEQMAVGSLTILFTDLKGSTRLYRQIGDAVAFGRVLNHFDVLREAIVAEEGVLIKTIGDAVMAAFRRPLSAVRAILRAQQTLAAPPDGMQPLLLKAGLHHGPCIAVTLNDRLDYFGSTVNMAARLEGLSSGEDIVLSDSVRHDPEVAAFLADPSHALSTEPFEVLLKGFDEERFALWRVGAEVVIAQKAVGVS